MFNELFDIQKRPNTVELKDIRHSFFDSFRVVEVDLIDPHTKDDVCLLVTSLFSIVNVSLLLHFIGSGANNGGETNFFKRPPAKNTLMDFMTTLKISRDSKINNEEEKMKSKEFFETKRRNNEPSYSTINTNTMINSTNSDSNNQSTDYPSESVDYTETTVSESTDLHDQLDSEDDPSQSIYRERRNPLPPR